MTRSRSLPVLLFAFVTLIVGCGFTGCQTGVGDLLVTKGAKEREVAALRVEYETRLKTQRDETAAAQAAVVAAKDAQIAGASTPLFAADVAFKGIAAPTRTDLVINNRVNEAWSALGHQMPTYEEMQKANARLAAELDENRTTLAALKATHETEMARGQTLADATAAAAKAMTDLTARHARELDDLSGKLTAATQALADANGLLAASATADGAREKARQAQLARLSWGAGILAALCLAGAIWSPVSKRELAIAAAVFAGAAVSIPFVEGLHVLIVAGVSLAAIIAWALFKHRKDERVADALTLAVQDVREKGGQAAAALDTAVADRLARYRKSKDGTLVTERDPSLEAHMAAKLAEYDALPGTPAVGPTP